MLSLLFYILRLQFLRCVISFNGLCDYRAGRVTALVILALRRYRTGHIARAQSESYG